MWRPVLPLTIKDYKAGLIMQNPYSKNPYSTMFGKVPS
jgi:hypothetical protein